MKFPFVLIPIFVSRVLISSFFFFFFFRKPYKFVEKEENFLKEKNINAIKKEKKNTNWDAILFSS